MTIDLTNCTPVQLEEALIKAASKTNALTMGVVEAKEVYDSLDDNKKAYLAVLTQNAEGDSVSAKEKAALTSSEWAEWLNGYKIARKTYEMLRAERDCWNRRWDTIRSVLSSRNSERRWQA